MNTCEFCHERFSHRNAAVRICRDCYFSGAQHDREHHDIMDRLNALPGVRAFMTHTGGGCFGLWIQCANGAVLFATTAFKADDGTWDTDAQIGQAGEPWAMGLYADEEAFANGEMVWQDILMPADDETLLATVRGQAHAEVTR